MKKHITFKNLHHQGLASVIYKRTSSSTLNPQTCATDNKAVSMMPIFFWGKICPYGITSSNLKCITFI